MVTQNNTSTRTIDCACVIHGSGYDWIYVDRLYNMLCRHLGHNVRFHVYAEAHRSVPDHMIKHELEEWKQVSGPRRSWWYKMQLFNSQHHSGDLLYFDLDTVIVRDISWMVNGSTNKMWTIKDFKYLQNPNYSGMNSSIMWWNVNEFAWLWDNFKKLDIADTIKKYSLGDQQYIGQELGYNNIRFFDPKLVQSWRWQADNGGVEFPSRKQRAPGTGTHIDQDVAVLVFHGQPKPHDLHNDVAVMQHWR
jgi:hypothetical protein